MSIEETLNERHITHGSFAVNSVISQRIKDHMRNCKNWSTLAQTQKESLEMIAHKIGRILAGNPDFKDHWEDIAGYATLVAKELK